MRIVHTMGASRAFWLAVGLVLVGWVTVSQAQHLVIGLDNKIDIDEAGKQVLAQEPDGESLHDVDFVVMADLELTVERGFDAADVVELCLDQLLL